MSNVGAPLAAPVWAAPVWAAPVWAAPVWAAPAPFYRRPYGVQLLLNIGIIMTMSTTVTKPSIVRSKRGS